MNNNAKLVNKDYRYENFCRGFKNLLKKWMLSNDAVEVIIEDDTVSCYQHKTRFDYQAYVQMWLDDNISSEQLTEFLKDRYFWAEYPLDTFLEMIKKDE